MDEPFLISPVATVVLQKVLNDPLKLLVVSVYPFAPHHAKAIPATIGAANDVPLIVVYLLALV